MSRSIGQDSEQETTSLSFELVLRKLQELYPAFIIQPTRRLVDSAPRTNAGFRLRRLVKGLSKQGLKMAETFESKTRKVIERAALLLVKHGSQECPEAVWRSAALQVLKAIVPSAPVYPESKHWPIIIRDELVRLQADNGFDRKTAFGMLEARLDYLLRADTEAFEIACGVYADPQATERAKKLARLSSLTNGLGAGRKKIRHIRKRSGDFCEEPRLAGGTPVDANGDMRIDEDYSPKRRAKDEDDDHDIF